MSWWRGIRARLSQDDSHLEVLKRREHCAERWFQVAVAEADDRVSRAQEESVRLLKAQAAVVPHEVREAGR